MKHTPARAVFCLLLVFIVLSSASAQKINLRDPIRLADDQALAAIYYFPHWWDPWKTDDDIVTADLRKMNDLGFNTICLDHEVSQAVDREWYWLDREYRLAGKENMAILPWLQLQAVDRVALMQFSHLQLKPAVNQNGQVEEDYCIYRDGDFKKALAHYVSVYLDRYINDPALLRIKDRGKLRPMVGLMVEVGWRNADGYPLSFDEETNDYFRRWMKSTSFNLAQLNEKWGTDFKSFDEIDPCDKAVFDYSSAEKSNMSPAVQEHMQFRARLINDALRDVAKEVRKRHKDVLFVAEVAYPFSSEDPAAAAYRWNSASDMRTVQFADIVLVRGQGTTCAGQMEKDHDTLILNGKRVILAQRIGSDVPHAAAVALALDCARTANGFAYYNWNETADDHSAIYNKEDRQALVKLMTSTYEMLYDVNKRHDVAAQPAVSLAPVELPPAQTNLEDVVAQPESEEASVPEQPATE